MIIGYTTGVFDMFHIGHSNIIKRAKDQCDYLIVGVSTDELVQHDKNKTPIIPFTDRCAIVEVPIFPDATRNTWNSRPKTKEEHICWTFI